ncbi:MAG: hypothetical protein JKY08_05150 [Flavobacteriaceae bacterium]|nr:hypothetical protein [Flavobacteriaceae bacterium]
MNNFTVKFLDPFNKEEQTIRGLRDHKIIEEFSNIPWHENIMEVYYSHHNVSRNKEERYVYNDYCCFVIEVFHSGKKQIINMVPNYAMDTDFSEKDVRFSIEYMRSKKVKTSRFERFFGAAQEKEDPSYMTHIKDITFEETIKIMNNFIEYEFHILEKSILNEGYLY